MVLNAHLYPAWGDKRLDEITTRGIQEFLNSKKDKARKTIQDMIMLLRVIMESALRDQLIDVNPASDRRLVNPSNRKTVREALPVEDVQDIIANLGKLETMDQRYMALAIFTGMRRGEIIGLRWEDVDLSANVLQVRRNVTFPKGDNRPCIGTPKTERPAKLCQAPKPRKRDVSSISASLDNRPCGWRGYDGDGDSGIINPLCSVAIGSIPSARPVVKAKPPAAVAASAGNPSGFGSGNLRIIRARETHYAAVTAATQRACMSFMCSSGVRIS